MSETKCTLELNGIPLSYWPFLIKEHISKGSLLVIVESERAAKDLTSSLRYICPSHPILYYPAWNISPYENSHVSTHVLAIRSLVLQDLLAQKTPSVVISTLSGVSVKCPPRSSLHLQNMVLRVTGVIKREALIAKLETFQYLRVDTVRERGEYAVRGGIIDIFPHHVDEPVRLDFFDNQIEKIWTFDPLDQRRLENQESVEIFEKTQGWNFKQQVERFRRSFREKFGQESFKHPIYQMVSEGKIPQGLEVWTPLFFDHLETLFDYLNPAYIFADPQIISNYRQFWADILSQYNLHKQTISDKVILDPAELYVSFDEMVGHIEAVAEKVFISPLKNQETPQINEVQTTLKFFSQYIHEPLHHHSFQRLQQWVRASKESQKKIHIACETKGTMAEIFSLLAQQEVKTLEAFSWDDERLADVYVHLWKGQESVVFKDKIILTAEEILGKASRFSKRKKSSELFIAEATNLNEGDYVVHEDHGVGKFCGLQTIDVAGVLHDCVCLEYEGGDKVYVPVENLDVLSRYGGGDSQVNLDKLGGSSWQQRKARVKKDLLAMAQELLAIAAQRQSAIGARCDLSLPIYGEFVSRFPYEETEDQLAAIQDIESDLSSGKLMDRLICGDVGFGKTEVALRAACLVAGAGKQVAIIVPTTLLAQQHYDNFQKRFTNLGVHIGMSCRLTKPKQLKRLREDLELGAVQVVIGTHGLLHDSIKFADLGLVIIDEEQHFGVKQKEKLKSLKKDLHVLTLTATPIPRTLQMSLAGVKDLSIIASPPIHRLAVHTQITTIESTSIREALIREKHRQGQSFYVCPRIKDIQKIFDKLTQIVPELTIAKAHGQMNPQELDEIMISFYKGEIDVLLATNIIESGLDVPRANTIIIHNADLFGLSQLYQLRGRVGRSSVQGYAYLTTPSDRKISESATKRLEVMQSLDALGAGFQLASYDLDIRGAGNVLGEEQSGHIREVGVELYQNMLEEAVLEIRHKEKSEAHEYRPEGIFKSPQINLGIPIFIPDTYVADLSVRLELYRRIAQLFEESDVHQMRVEIIDRFGPIPQEVENLFSVLKIKKTCKDMNIGTLQVGEKGVMIRFIPNTITNPEKLLIFIHKQKGVWKIRPDQSVYVTKLFSNPQQKVQAAEELLHQLQKEAF